METEQPSQENQDRQVNPPGEEQGSSQVRSYECTFCRRGFSNAQALGGHMNVHRKDKAKLKHSYSSSASSSPSSNEPQQSLDTTKIISIPPPFSTNPLTEAKFSEDRSSIIWPWILDKQTDDSSKRNKTYVAGIMQLPLFDDKPSSKDQQQQHSRTEKGLLLSNYGLSSSELDLELRLGPEPQDSSSPAMGTKRPKSSVETSTAKAPSYSQSQIR